VVPEDGSPSYPIPVITPERGEATADLDLKAPRQAGLARALLPPGDDVNPAPLLVFNPWPHMVNLLAGCSSLDCWYAPTLADVKLALMQHRFSGILARSPQNGSGQAYQAIEAYRRRNDGLVIYEATDYRWEIVAPRALEIRADILLAGGGPVGELTQFFLAGLAMKRRGLVPPPSEHFYEAFIRKTMPNATMWMMSEVVRSRGMAVSPDI
jgi:hypothetical protein